MMSKISEIYHYSSQHRAFLQQSERCGCFYCLETFAYSEIEDCVIMSKPQFVRIVV